MNAVQLQINLEKALRDKYTSRKKKKFASFLLNKNRQKRQKFA